jgi:tRNA A37 threonylcarbamoyladenosine synthetase subunit TsaC/SUA5/YrdC
MIVVGCNEEDLARAASLLRVGGRVITPTEASYFLVSKQDKDLEKEGMLLIDRNTAETFLRLGPIGNLLASRFWPGPLLLMARQRADNRFIYVNVPKNKCVRWLMEMVGAPLLTLESGNSLEELMEKCRLKADMAINDGPVHFSEGYTTVKVEGYTYRIIKEGAIKRSLIDLVVKEVFEG